MVDNAMRVMMGGPRGTGIWGSASQRTRGRGRCRSVTARRRTRCSSRPRSRSCQEPNPGSTVDPFPTTCLSASSRAECSVAWSSLHARVRVRGGVPRHCLKKLSEGTVQCSREVEEEQREQQWRGPRNCTGSWGGGVWHTVWSPATMLHPLPRAKCPRWGGGRRGRRRGCRGRRRPQMSWTQQMRMRKLSMQGEERRAGVVAVDREYRGGGVDGDREDDLAVQERRDSSSG